MANPVLSFPELYRLAHAFLGGHPYKPGDVVYVIFSRAAPLFRIQGIFRQRADARRELATAPADWEPAELNARIIYKVTMPDDPPVSLASPGSYDSGDQPPLQTVMCVRKPYWTEAEFTAWTASAADDDLSSGRRTGAVLPPPGSIHEVTRMELRLWTKDGSWRVELPRLSEVVFLTAHAIDSILMPYYYAVFGRRHAEQRRRSLFDAARRAASGVADQRSPSGRTGRGGASRSKRKRG